MLKSDTVFGDTLYYFIHSISVMKILIVKIKLMITRQAGLGDSPSFREYFFPCVNNYTCQDASLRCLWVIQVIRFKWGYSSWFIRHYPWGLLCSWFAFSLGGNEFIMKRTVCVILIPGILSVWQNIFEKNKLTQIFGSQILGGFS